MNINQLSLAELIHLEADEHSYLWDLWDGEIIDADDRHFRLDCAGDHLPPRPMLAHPRTLIDDEIIF